MQVRVSRRSIKAPSARLRRRNHMKNLAKARDPVFGKRPFFFFGSKKKLTASDAEVRAATRIQARIRGNKARTSIQRFGDALFAPVKMVMDAGEEMIKGGGDLVQAAVGRKRAPAVSDEEVAAATPADHWFTPREGWKKRMMQNKAPHQMMPTALTVDSLFPAPEDIIGELRVEVLEAANLPNKDTTMGVINTGNYTDPYALLVFEGCAARTSVVFDSLSPRWAAADPSSYRAFSFPVTRPYSVLYVSLFDFDGCKKDALEKDKDLEKPKGGTSKAIGSLQNARGGAVAMLDPDDPIGRVGIQLGRLAGSTEYDLWLDLGYGAIEKPNGKLGCVRLRISVTFPSERKRMLAYLKTTPTPIIPFNKSNYRKNALFAKYGKGAKQTYDWDVLMVYIDELKTVVRLMITFVAVIEDILLWRRSSCLTSAALCLLCQFLVSRPSYIPASWGLIAIAFLHRTYVQQSDDPRLDLPIHARPTFLQLFKALIFDTPPTPIKAVAQSYTTADGKVVAAAPGSSPAAAVLGALGATFTHSPPPSEAFGDGFVGGLLYWFFGSSGTAAASIAGDIKLTAEKYWHHKILGESEEDEEASKELASERQKIDEEVEKYIDEGDDSIEDKIVKKREKSRAKNDDGFIGKIARHVNPIAVALGPVQKNLAMTMMPLRMVRYTLFWQDRIFTLWLYIALLVLTLILAILPWGMILYYCSRCIGFCILGPHMHFVGRKIDANRRQARKEVQEYKEADDAGKDAILEAYREELMKAAHQTVRKAQVKIAGKSTRELERLKFLETQKYNFVNGNTRANARIKFVAIADPSRSSAGPLG